jgi:hypothetical protein
VAATALKTWCRRLRPARRSNLQRALQCQRQTARLLRRAAPTVSALGFMDGLYAEELGLCVTRLLGVVAFLGAAHTEAVLVSVALFPRFHVSHLASLQARHQAPRHGRMCGRVCWQGLRRCSTSAKLPRSASPSSAWHAAGQDLHPVRLAVQCSLCHHHRIAQLAPVLAAAGAFAFWCTFSVACMWWQLLQ